MDITVIIILFAEAVFALLLLKSSGLLSTPRRILAASVLLLLLFGLRLAAFDYKTDDYLVFLSSWVQYFRDSGGFSGLGRSIGNYSPPYLYFLALFSYFNIDDLYLIKLLSVFFDIILAYACERLVSLFTESEGRRLAVFLSVLALPTVVLNGSLWAQCDSIYVSFALLGLYFGLARKPVRSMIFMALSLAFKLQAVFILPICAVLLFTGNIKFKHVFVFIAAYIIILLPPVLFGQDFADVLTAYFTQAGSVGSSLNYNSPSLYSIIAYNADAEIVSGYAVASAAFYMFIILIAAFIGRRRLNNSSLLLITLLFVIGIPFLLPHMHDRYFFMADVLTLCFAFIVPEYFPAAVFSQLASLLCYYAYLNMQYLIHPKYNGFLMLAALIITLTFSVFKGAEKPSTKN